MSIEAKGGEEGNEEDIGEVGIRDPHRLHLLLPFIHQRRHDPVLHTVLPLEAGAARPRRHGGRGGIRLAVEHGEVEAAGEVVHVDAEGEEAAEAAAGRGRVGEGEGEGREVGSEVEVGGEEGEGEEEEEGEEEGGDGLAGHGHGHCLVPTFSKMDDKIRVRRGWWWWWG